MTNADLVRSMTDEELAKQFTVVAVNAARQACNLIGVSEAEITEYHLTVLKAERLPKRKEEVELQHVGYTLESMGYDK